MPIFLDRHDVVEFSAEEAHVGFITIEVPSRSIASLTKPRLPPPGFSVAD
jgi:hypothetical protein